MSYSQYVSYHTTEMYYFARHISSLTDEGTDIVIICGNYCQPLILKTFTVPVTVVKNPVTGSLDLPSIPDSLIGVTVKENISQTVWLLVCL